MENASKALLIAGSIVIALLLIAAGVRVFNSTEGTSQSLQDSMNATEITTFNNKFLPYAGSRKSAGQVKSLANVVIAHNGVNKQYTVKFADETNSTNIIKEVADVDVSKTYTISMTDSDNNGLIDEITFSEEP